MGIVAKSQAVVRWPQSHKAPLDGFYNVYIDGSFASPINSSPIPAWPDGTGRRGFGSGLFGAGMFGLGAVGLPFGKYRFGMGLFGFGANMMEFTTPECADGVHTFTIVGIDAAGNPAAPASGTDVQVTLAGTPEPPGVPTADSYNPITDALTLTFALSDDDAG